MRISFERGHKKMKLARFLRALRLARKMSIPEVAKKSGISEEDISRLEAGKYTDPSPEVLKALSDAMETDYEIMMQVAGYLRNVPVKPELKAFLLKENSGDGDPAEGEAMEMLRNNTELVNSLYAICKAMNAKDLFLMRELLAVYLKEKKEN